VKPLRTIPILKTRDLFFPRCEAADFGAAQFEKFGAGKRGLQQRETVPVCGIVGQQVRIGLDEILHIADQTH
jgi:hypothetical protein